MLVNGGAAPGSDKNPTRLRKQTIDHMEGHRNRATFGYRHCRGPRRTVSTGPHKVPQQEATKGPGRLGVFPL
jgi:hypothetical protein